MQKNPINFLHANFKIILQRNSQRSSSNNRHYEDNELMFDIPINIQTMDNNRNRKSL